MNSVSNFIALTMAMIVGDKAREVAEKNWRRASTALKSELSTLDAKIEDLNDDLADSKNALDAARVNGGEVISKDARSSYIRNLIAAKNNVAEVEEELEAAKTTKKFLSEELESLGKISSNDFEVIKD